MSKAITSGQARNMIASFTVDTPWEEIDVDLQSFIELPPKERGERFAHFLKYGCVAKKPSEYNISHTPFEPVSVPPLDYIVRVDRSVKPSYPDWVKKKDGVIHPGLEAIGPAEYDLSQVEQWLHDDQKHGSVVGNTIYKHLQKGTALATCLNLQDGLAIQQKGIAVFRKLFASKAVFLWGSVVRNHRGLLVVPCLYGDGGKVVMGWDWLGCSWDSSDPALRFGK